MFAIRGIVFSYEAVREWEAKLTPALAEELRKRRRGKVGRSWYVDETYLKVHGRWCYLYRAIDRNGNLVDVLLAKSRPARKPSGAGTRAVIAVAAIGPMPGIVMSRRATGSALARRAISPSSSLSCSSKALSILISTCRVPRALSGTEDFGSSTSATRLATCAGPCGTTWPYSARCPRKALMHCVRCRTSRSRTRNTTALACCASSQICKEPDVRRHRRGPCDDRERASFASHRHSLQPRPLQ